MKKAILAVVVSSVSFGAVSDTLELNYGDVSEISAHACNQSGSYEANTCNFNIDNVNVDVSKLTDNQLATLKGADGDSAYQVWLAQGKVGSVTDYLLAIKGGKGDTGDTGGQGNSVVVAAGANDSIIIQGYQADGSTLTQTITQGADGVDGANGDSAYQVWLSDGNSGTKGDFFTAIEGVDGDSVVVATGENGSLIVKGYRADGSELTQIITQGVDGTDGKTAYVTTNTDGSITVGIEGDTGQVATFVDTDTVRSDTEIDNIANNYDDSAAINALAVATSKTTNDIANATQNNTISLATLTDSVAAVKSELTDEAVIREAGDLKALNDAKAYTDSSVISVVAAQVTVNNKLADSTAVVAKSVVKASNESIDRDVVLTDAIDNEAIERKAGDAATLVSAKTHTVAAVAVEAAARKAADAAQVLYNDKMDALYSAHDTEINSNTSRSKGNSKRLAKVETEIAGIHTELNTVKKGVAMAAALGFGSNLHTKNHNGNWTMTPSIAHYKGNTALALTAQVSVTDDMAIRVGYSNVAKDILDIDKGIVGGAVTFSF